MAVVNVQPGAEFGQISVSNKYFWELIGCQKYEQANVSHLFIKEMQEYHNNNMLNFLSQNKHNLSPRQGFIVNGSKELVEVEISAQILPDLTEGLYVAIFTQELKSNRAIFLISNSRILVYSRKFQEDFLLTHKLSDYDEVITKEVLSRLQESKESTISIGGESVLFRLQRTIPITGK